LLLLNDEKRIINCGVGVTLKYMRLLYHEIRSTGSIEEARGHTDSMERQGANSCVAGKGRVVKYTI
jgi:hypothetical protein